MIIFEPNALNFTVHTTWAKTKCF